MGTTARSFVFGRKQEPATESATATARAVVERVRRTVHERASDRPTVTPGTFGDRGTRRPFAPRRAVGGRGVAEVIATLYGVVHPWLQRTGCSGRMSASTGSASARAAVRAHNPAAGEGFRGGAACATLDVALSGAKEEPR